MFFLWLSHVSAGVANLDSGVGVYAPDAESYSLFAPLFDPIIEEYHMGFKKTDKHPPCDFGDVETLSNVDPAGEFVISTRVRCGRSLVVRSYLLILNCTLYLLFDRHSFSCSVTFLLSEFISLSRAV